MANGIPGVSPLNIDTSMYGSRRGPGGPGAGNPFAILNQATQLQARVNQNRLFQQEFTANKALGELAQQAVDPGTGAMDWDKYGMMISTDPRTSFKARQVLEGLANRRLLDAQTFGAKLSNAKNTLGMISNSLTPIVREWSKAPGGIAPPDKNDPSKADLSGVLDQASILIGQNPAMKDQVMDTLIQLRGMDRSNATKTLFNMVNSAQIAERGIDGVLGTKEFEGVTPEGTPYTVKGQVNKITGQVMPYTKPGERPGVVEQPGAATSAGEGTGAGAESLGAAETPPASLPPGAIQTGLDPYRKEALGKIAAEYEPELNERAKGANQLLAIMSQAQDYLKNFTPGGGTEFLLGLGKLAQAAGAPQSVLDRIASAQEEGGFADAQAARKILFGIGSQIAATLISAGGGRMTQTEWAQTLSRGSPSLDLDPKAISKIMGSMRELAHYTKMESSVFDRYKGQGRDLTRWQNEWQEILGDLIATRESRRRKK